MIRRRISQALLWVSVLAWSLWLGGLLHEMVVILPPWSASPPESVLEWNARPQYVINPTGFYPPVALTTVLSSVAALIAGWGMPSSRRRWPAISAVCAFTTLVFTIIYFFPKNEVLFRNRSSGLSGEEITVIARGWVTANRLRVCIMAAGFLSALRALSIPSQIGVRP